MKQKLLVLYRHLPWLLLLAGINGLAALMLWLADTDAFFAMCATILLTTILLFAAVFSALLFWDRKKKQNFEAFLNNPDTCQEENFLKAVSASEADSIRLLGRILREKELALNHAKTDLADYE